MMFRFTLPIMGGLLALTGADMPASAQRFQRGEDQQDARKAMLDGQVMPFSVIKRRVEREMDEATYVGVAPPPREGIYRMQFLRKDGKVVWVDVDGKTGNIIARTR
ncbi:hypothetical protein [Sphingobium nicotianae]|uniref:PepSY domain-containing protein n=1 Tax=Sphingobium nicotianae TaxID=2782607 RepID=A0A9X1DC16_9SPHN|nr:hypothetical protein [Sphingobium nicotianae]MBT2187100.1 hypothetical protein [Sphingobium nicotianae]